VPSIRFRLDDPSPAALTAKVRAEFGDNARIVSASEVRLGGVGGFFARRFVDVVVDVPKPAAAPIPTGSYTAVRDPAPGSFGAAVSAAAGPVVSGPVSGPVASGAPVGSGPVGTGAVGLEALLAAAERAERNGMPPSSPPVVPAVSTQTEDFDRLMADLSFYSGPAAAPAPAAIPPAAPVLYDEPGGLVLFVGLGNDALVVARSLARSVRWSDVRIGGRILEDGFQRVDDRRSASAFRARGVEAGSVGLLAWGAGVGMTGVSASVVELMPLNPDQIWVVVDASRKADDTAAWVGALRASLPVKAVAVLHGVETSTPDSVNALGLPIGWSDTVG
jgi:hypothetical protein